MLIKFREAQEAFESGFFHAHYVPNAHVIGHKRAYLLSLFIGHAEAAADFLCHQSADFSMLVETNTIENLKSWRLAYVMQQHAERQSFRAADRKAFEQQKCMDPDISFGVIFRRLLDALHFLDLGQDLLKQAGFIQQFKSAFGPAFGEHLQDFVTNALPAHLMDLRGALATGDESGLVDLIPKMGSKAHGAQHA